MSHPRLRLLPAAAAAAATLALAACSGPAAALAPASGARLPGLAGATAAPPPASIPSPPMASMMPSAAASASAGAGAAPVATNAVTIQNFAFAPAVITVRAGTTVRWTNRDTDAHTVTSDTSAFGSAALSTGGSYAHTFSRPGTYRYHCSIHPFMVATVVVTA